VRYLHTQASRASRVAKRRILLDQPRGSTGNNVHNRYRARERERERETPCDRVAKFTSRSFSRLIRLITLRTAFKRETKSNEKRPARRDARYCDNEPTPARSDPWTRSVCRSRRSARLPASPPENATCRLQLPRNTYIYKFYPLYFSNSQLDL